MVGGLEGITASGSGAIASSAEEVSMAMLIVGFSVVRRL